MELADLQVFTTVVEEGGIAAAARKLHRVPSSVTTRVQQLEATLGVRLFVRERQRLHLSTEGERLLEYADRMLRLADEARSAVAGLPGGVLRLGALESTTASRLPAVLGRFHRVCRRLSCLISPARRIRVSRSPYSMMSCAAVLTPMPGTPGTLSLESPISAWTSITFSGPTPNFSITSARPMRLSFIVSYMVTQSFTRAGGFDPCPTIRWSPSPALRRRGGRRWR